MLVQTVTFESTLTEEGVTRVAREREPAYRAVPGLIQKLYLRCGAPNTYSGIMLWESAEALAAFRDSDLAKTIPTAYGVKGAPEIRVAETMFLLRESVELAA